MAHCARPRPLALTESPDRRIVERLRAAGSVFADDEARLLAGDEKLIARRVAGERLEHVLGWVEFAGLRIEVDPGVFVPRPQTEELAERAAALAPALALDLFAGAGAIACVVKARNPRARVVAAELEPAALACARRNGERFGVEVVHADVDDGVPPELAGRVDVLTANVPYVPRGELPYVPHEDEPAQALDGGDDGLDWVRRVAAIAPRWLRPGGSLLVEVADDERASAAAEQAVASAGFAIAAAGERVLHAEKRPATGLRLRGAT